MSASNGLGLEHEVEALLRSRGYTPIRKLGEGNTREAVEVDFKHGKVRRRRVAKIPKKEINGNSITTRINLSKGNPDEREIAALNPITHPNIVEIYEAFDHPGADRTITIEEYCDAVSLEDLVRIAGPVTDPRRFNRMFSQVIDGLEYLHREQELLHRDLKASNILVDRKHDICKITDLQNAGSVTNQQDTLLTTRGATDYSDPRLLNALLLGKPTRADVRSDIYSLGVTMYFALTGKVPFRLSLVPDVDGRMVSVNGRTIGISLLKDGNRITGIDYEEHEKELNKALQDVPNRYRSLLRTCLSLKEQKCQRNINLYPHEILRGELTNATRENRLESYSR